MFYWVYWYTGMNGETFRMPAQGHPKKALLVMASQLRAACSPVPRSPAFLLLPPRWPFPVPHVKTSLPVTGLHSTADFPFRLLSQLIFYSYL